MTNNILKITISAFIVFLMALMWISFNKIEVEEKPSRYEIVKFCQELSATANEDWGYKSCLEQLEESLSTERVIKI